MTSNIWWARQTNGDWELLETNLLWLKTITEINNKPWVKFTLLRTPTQVSSSGGLEFRSIKFRQFFEALNCVLYILTSILRRKSGSRLRGFRPTTVCDIETSSTWKHVALLPRDNSCWFPTSTMNHECTITHVFAFSLALITHTATKEFTAFINIRGMNLHTDFTNHFFHSPSLALLMTVSQVF